MPEQASGTPTRQVTSGGAGHPDKRWAGSRKSGTAATADVDPAAAAAVAAVARWFAHERAQLRAVAETLEIVVMEHLRHARQQPAVGPGAARLGLRIRAPRRVGRTFIIEWFLVQRPGRTHYIPRGGGDRYPRAAFAAALPWERGITLAAEQTLGRIRRRLRLMKDIEQRVAAFEALAAHGVDTQSGPAGEAGA